MLQPDAGAGNQLAPVRGNRQRPNPQPSTFGIEKEGEGLGGLAASVYSAFDHGGMLREVGPDGQETDRLPRRILGQNQLSIPGVMQTSW